MTEARQILNNIKYDISCLNVKFDLNSIKKIIENNGCGMVDTHGLPFNGTTYEIVRYFDFQGRKLKETIGHFKYVIAIYGDNVCFRLYDNNCIGGSNLNGSESNKFIYARDFIKRF